MLCQPLCHSDTCHTIHQSSAHGTRHSLRTATMESTHHNTFFASMLSTSGKCVIDPPLGYQPITLTQPTSPNLSPSPAKAQPLPKVSLSQSRIFQPDLGASTNILINVMWHDTWPLLLQFHARFLTFTNTDWSLNRRIGPLKNSPTL